MTDWGRKCRVRQLGQWQSNAGHLVVGDLDEMLAENARQPKRQRLTLVRIYEALRNRGYDGSYDAVRR